VENYSQAYLCCSLGPPNSCLVMTKYKSIPEPKLPTHIETSEQENEDDAGEEEGENNDYEFKKWCGFRRSTVLFLFYVISYCSYLIVGGYIMCILETETEQILKAETRKLKEEFLQKYPNINETEFEQMLYFVTEYSKRGISVLDSSTLDNWSLGQSLLFTVTVVTTVGYGHIAPLTTNGKLFCIFYACCGIPFTLVFLSACVQRLQEPTFRMLAWMMSGRMGKWLTPLGVRVIHLLILCTLFSICFVVTPTFIFSQLEPSWDVLDAFYYVFISLTTIGLGDYIPGDGNQQQVPELLDLYKASVAVYLLFGLIFMTLTMTVFYDIPQLNLGLHLHSYADIRPQDSKKADNISVASLKEEWHNNIRRK